MRIDKVTRTASGALGTARLEPLPDPDPAVDTYQEKGIDCYLDAAVGSVLVRCEAFNTSAWLACVSDAPAFVSALAAMNSDSKITFTANADGTCAHLVVDNSSIYQQKAN